MSTAELSSPRRITADELIALNEEIAMLVRSGVPLELGLGMGGRGRLNELSAALSEQMERGVPLETAVADARHKLPRVYAAVIEAGAKAGDLPAALESLAVHSRSLADLRRRIGLALIYPTIVVVVAYALLILFLGRLTRAVQETYVTFRIKDVGWLSLLESINWFIYTWGWVFPVLAVGVFASWIVMSRFVGPTSGVAGAAMRWIPWLGGIIRTYHQATFAELLAILLEHRLPLPDALRTAARATGDGRVIGTADQAAEEVESGRTLAEAVQSNRGVPPFVKWMMTTGDRQNALPAAMRQAAVVYRRRAERRADWFRVVMPIVLTAVFAGGLTLLYVLTLFLPMAGLWRGLGSDAL